MLCHLLTLLAVGTVQGYSDEWLPEKYSKILAKSRLNHSVVVEPDVCISGKLRYYMSELVGYCQSDSGMSASYIPFRFFGELAIHLAYMKLIYLCLFGLTSCILAMLFFLFLFGMILLSWLILPIGLVFAIVKHKSIKKYLTYHSKELGGSLLILCVTCLVTFLLKSVPSSYGGFGLIVGIVGRFLVTMIPFLLSIYASNKTMKLSSRLNSRDWKLFYTADALATIGALEYYGYLMKDSWIWN